MHHVHQEPIPDHWVLSCEAIIASTLLKSIKVPFLGDQKSTDL